MKFRDIRNLDRDDFLGLLGLETKHPLGHRLLGILAPFAIGLLVGAGVALLLAPKPGSEMRHDLREKLQCGCKGSATDDEDGSCGSAEEHA